MKTVVFLVIAAILAGLAALYGLFGESSRSVVKDANFVEPEEKLTEVPIVEKFTGESTLMDLFAFNKSLECKISYVPPDTVDPVIGTYFISDGKLRGDFEIKSPEYETPFVSSMINDRDMFYSWSKIAGQAYGVKIDTANFEEADSDVVREPVPVDANVSYDCTEWKNVDGSIFEPPTDVLFKDMNAIMQSGMEFGTIYEDSI